MDNQKNNPSQQQTGRSSKDSETKKYARPDDSSSKDRKDTKTGGSGCGC